MNTERPFEDNVPSGGEEPSYEWLDEWLCEYVDGTMDPSLEAVFEQYVQANPELKAHVERLQETRDLLCSCGFPTEAPDEVEAEVCQEVKCDLRESSVPESGADQDRPLTTLGLVSSVAVALVVGFLVGATVVNPSPSGPAPANRVASDPPLPSSSPDVSGDPVDERLYRPTGAVSPTDSARSAAPLRPVGTP